jgi:hypothetical protein
MDKADLQQRQRRTVVLTAAGNLSDQGDQTTWLQARAIQVTAADHHPAEHRINSQRAIAVVQPVAVEFHGHVAGFADGSRHDTAQQQGAAAVGGRIGEHDRRPQSVIDFGVQLDWHR